jgi:hypothetical protein
MSDATDTELPAEADPPRGRSTNDGADTAGGVSPGPRCRRLTSRVVVTWAELVVVGFAGAALSGATSGPPQLVVYLATTLLSVGILLYNVDRLVRARLA